MTNSIAGYYINELEGWKEILDFNMENIDEMYKEVKEILRSNTIINLAEKVQYHLSQLQASKENLAKLHSKLNEYEKKFYPEQRAVTNDSITKGMKAYQQQLRREMHQLEKEYVDVKYDCDRFLADTITAQNSKTEK
jgi:DNA repair ATPase RecN